MTNNDFRHSSLGWAHAAVLKSTLRRIMYVLVAVFRNMLVKDRCKFLLDPDNPVEMKNE